jgi:hypothetical protein
MDVEISFLIHNVLLGFGFLDSLTTSIACLPDNSFPSVPARADWRAGEF